MKKSTYRILCAIVLLSFCLPMAVTASAATIDTQMDSSLTLVYKSNGQVFEGLSVQIYHVADVKDDYAFTLAGEFANYPVKLYGITSQAEWKIICQTMESYIMADGLKPAATAKTDATGTVKFDDLTPGMYLTMPITHHGEEVVTDFFSFLTVIPNRENDGSLNYDVTAYPKSSQHEPGDDKQERELKVLKQWKDSGFEANRPASVQVDLYRNGELHSTVELSAANNWCHKWTTANDGASWVAVERNIPEEYTVTIQHTEGSIILTNVRESGGPPDSGDSTILWPYIMGMCVSGFAVILLALMKKKEMA